MKSIILASVLLLPFAVSAKTFEVVCVKALVRSDPQEIAKNLNAEIAKIPNAVDVSSPTIGSRSGGGSYGLGSDTMLCVTVTVGHPGGL